MDLAPIQLVVAFFPDENGAKAALLLLREAKREMLSGIKDVALLRRDETDQIHVTDLGQDRAAVAGGLFGVAIALLAGGRGVLLSGAAGAVVAQLASRRLELGLRHERLQALGQALGPGSSALVALVESKWLADLQAEMATAGARVAVEALAGEIAQRLAEDKAPVENLPAAEGGAAPEGPVELKPVAAGQAGVAAQAAVTTPAGAAGPGLAITKEGVLTGAAAPAVAEEKSKSIIAEALLHEYEE